MKCVLGCEEFLDSCFSEEEGELCGLSLDQSLHVLRPSRLCAPAQSGDDKLSHKQAYMEYIQLVFCKVFRMPRECHRACPTRMHDSHLLSFQGYVLNHDSTLPPGHLFEGDTELLNDFGIYSSLMLDFWLNDLFHANFVSAKFRVNTLDIESFQPRARLYDFRTIIRAVFSSTLKSFAIMTGNLSSPSRNAYSRWGGGDGSSFRNASKRSMSPLGSDKIDQLSVK
nr:hypothetical protein [Tanacetum cinerariifolium]